MLYRVVPLGSPVTANVAISRPIQRAKGWESATSSPSGTRGVAALCSPRSDACTLSQLFNSLWPYDVHI